MKTHLCKKLVCMLLVLSMVLLSACGNSAITEDNPNLGVYKAVKARMSGIVISNIEEIWEGGFIIELKKKGKGTATIGGESASIKWTLEGETFHAEGGGVTFDGTLKDGVMEFENFDDSDISLTLVCDEVAAAAKNAGGTGDTAAAGSADGADASGAGSIYGKYDAVSASANGGDNVWIEAGEYLIVNEDDTVSMYVAEQDLEFDTTIKDKKFYLNGDTRVGRINDDGSISLQLSDEVEYTFAKKGSDLWNEWKEVMGETEEPEDTAWVDDSARPDKDTDEPDDSTGKSSRDKLNDMLSGDEEDIGRWELFALTQGGKSYMEDDLKKKGIESWIQINAGGRGQIYYVGDLMDMEWGNGKIVVPENEEGERDEYRYSISSGNLVLVDQDMTLAFRRVE